ncbi:O-antigen ligase [Janthinobacterium psychrotolerans]|uniref:O-antigen ligase n=1 Tax=Janthinobacterium psychrotolerans TaxID=1747903 RepID=A0A1A7BVR6_9BURK|nr:O-antigen ligase [Janthinobacterium psychrotolerans]
MLRLTSVCVFLFSALSVSVDSGYSFGAVGLLLSSACLSWKRPRLGLQRQDWTLIAVLLAYFSVLVANMAYHGDPGREFDMPLRALLVVPVLLLLLAYPPRPAAWWGGVAVGAIAGAALALWQFTMQDMVRPQGSTSNAIHYGNVSMLLGMLSLAGLEWARTQRRALAWCALLLAGCLAGVFGSILSGSRGGWIALPVCVLIIAMHNARAHGKRYLVITLSTMALLMVTAYYVPHSPIRERAAMAVTEVEKMNDPANATTSIGQRFEAWHTALLLSTEHPLLGIGRNGYLDEKKQWVREGKMGPDTSEATNAHNDYLDVLVKRGVIGLLALFGLFLLPLYLFGRALRHGAATAHPYALGGVVLCVCYIIFGMTTSSLTLNIGIIMLVFPMAMQWALLRHAQRGA